MLKLISLLLTALSLNVYAQNIDQTKCDSDQSLVLMYLNGVATTTDGEGGSEDSKKTIRGLVSKDESQTRISSSGLDDICYKYIYNQEDGIYDFIETLAQKIRERDSSLSEDEVYSNVSKFLFVKNAFLQTLFKTNPFLVDDLTETEIQRVKTAEYNTLHVDTAPIVRDDLKDRSVLVVSHSQGNLFANLIYEELKKYPEVSGRFAKYANLQVGSAAATIQAEKGSYGDYMTSRQDLVINGLGELFSTLHPNVEMHYVLEDLGNTTRKKYDYEIFDRLGHGFVDVYTNSNVGGKLDGEANFRSMSSIFMDKLEALTKEIVDPACDPRGAEKGDLALSGLDYFSEVELVEGKELFTFYPLLDGNIISTFNLSKYKVFLDKTDEGGTYEKLAIGGEQIETNLLHPSTVLRIVYEGDDNNGYFCSRKIYFQKYPNMEIFPSNNLVYQEDGSLQIENGPTVIIPNSHVSIFEDYKVEVNGQQLGSLSELDVTSFGPDRVYGLKVPYIPSTLNYNVRIQSPKYNVKFFNSYEVTEVPSFQAPEPAGYFDIRLYTDGQYVFNYKHDSTGEPMSTGVLVHTGEGLYYDRNAWWTPVCDWEYIWYYTRGGMTNKNVNEPFYIYEDIYRTGILECDEI